MKYLVCSDIHGSLLAAEKIIDFFEKSECDRILLLGDVLYHGPRNPLPEGHDPKGVCELLNKYSEKISACRGNCDAEVDQKVLAFPIMADFVEIVDGGRTLFCTHGHVYAPLNDDGKMPFNCEDAKMPKVSAGSIIFYGHTHISVLEKRENGIVVCNPGSVSLPKGGSQAGFAVFDSGAGKISLLNINGEIIKELTL